MKISRERLSQESEDTGFRADIVEKVIYLLELLQALHSHPYLAERLALKGGTALNLFVFELPRLSVDLDLNYVGDVDAEALKTVRPDVESAVKAVLAREGFEIKRPPTEHAGGKWLLQYESALGQRGNLEIDLNYMFRVPLWPIVPLDSYAIGSFRATGIPTVDIHELAAGKLAALLARHTGRDLFDSYRLLSGGSLDPGLLRLAFVVYGAGNRKDWRGVSVDDVDFDPSELQSQLVPLLMIDPLKKRGSVSELGRQLVCDVRSALSIVLPFSSTEREFLDLLLDHGQIEPSLLTSDRQLAERISRQPMLEWKALNVRQYRERRAAASSAEPPQVPDIH